MNRFAWLLVVVLLVLAAWTVGWFVAAENARAAVVNLGAADGQSNPKISCESLDISGFPFRFDLECANATVESGDLTATLAGIRASLLVYNPTHAVLSARSPIGVADAFTGSRSRVDFAEAEGSVRLANGDLWAGLRGEGWRLARASLVARDLDWTDTLAGENVIATGEQLEVHLLDIPERHDPEQGLSAVAVFARISDLAAPALEVAEGEINLEADLSGLPDDLRDFSDPALLQRWRDADGEVDLLGLTASAGDDFLTASGTLRLDAEARPEGQLQLASRGVVERLGDLVPAEWRGLILGGQADDGSYSQVLTLRAGVILSGLVPLGMVPPLF